MDLTSVQNTSSLAYPQKAAYNELCIPQRGGVAMYIILGVG